MALGGKSVLAEIVRCLGTASLRVGVCGPPALALTLAAAGHRVVAVGQRHERLRAAQRRWRQATAAPVALLRADLAHLPLADGALEAFVYAGALPVQAAAALAAWERVVADGGQVVVAGSVGVSLGVRLRARFRGVRVATLAAHDYTRLVLCAGLADVAQVWPRRAVVITAARARKVGGAAEGQALPCS